MPQEKACVVRGRAVEQNELHQRIKGLEEEMRPHDLEEGYEWPGSEESVEQPAERR